MPSRPSDDSATAFRCSGRLSTPTMRERTFALVGDLEAEFGGDYNLVTAAFHRLADEDFIVERPIDFRRIEKGDANIHCAMQRADCIGFILPAIGEGHAHAAKAHAETLSSVPSLRFSITDLLLVW